MQTILGTTADAVARATRFVQRQSKLTGAKFVQTLVFGWIANPEATLEELSQTAATLGVTITAQGIDARFTPAAADCLQAVLEEAVAQVLEADPVAVPILQRFNGVYVQDSSTICLPDALATVWAGCGNRVPGNEAALKLQVRLNLNTGTLQGPLLQDGRAHDRRSPLETVPLPAGALRIADLGFFSLDRLQELDHQQVYWLSRLKVQTAVFNEQGQRQGLWAWLEAQQRDDIDLPIRIGAEQHLPCRLLAQRVPQEVADQRRRRLREQARKKGQMVSPMQLKLAAWTIYITNAPTSLLSLREAMVLVHARWQIELLFKLWKRHGRVDESRSRNPVRILCEVYAKLLAMLIQHWLLLVGCWAYPDRSLHKAIHTVQKHAFYMAAGFGCAQRLCEAITTIQRCLAAGCRINKRKTTPHTYQLLLALTDNGGLA